MEAILIGLGLLAIGVIGIFLILIIFGTVRIFIHNIFRKAPNKYFEDVITRYIIPYKVENILMEGLFVMIFIACVAGIILLAYMIGEHCLIKN